MHGIDLAIGDGFWVALVQIIIIDLILSGDNAVVIALACRNLPEKQRKLAIFLGAGAAIGLRIVFAFFIIQLMAIPYLKIVGSVLLLWIGVKLLLPEDEGHGEGKLGGGSTIFSAIRTIVIADAVMSLDNVIAIAAAAKDSVLLIAIGLLISIPLIIYGSQLLLTFLLRYPILVTLGGGLLGWIAGEMFFKDPAVAHIAENWPAWSHYVSAAAGALFVIVLGTILARRMKARKELVDLAQQDQA